jgi:clumping factor A
MHGSWETANGLNPNSNDATLDPDGDGASNLAEYQAGSDPKSAASIP